MLDPVELLRQRLKSHTYRQLGALYGLSATYLHQVATEERPPSDRLLKAMGLVKTVTYKQARSPQERNK